MEAETLKKLQIGTKCGELGTRRPSLLLSCVCVCAAAGSRGHVGASGQAPHPSSDLVPGASASNAASGSTVPLITGRLGLGRGGAGPGRAFWGPDFQFSEELLPESGVKPERVTVRPEARGPCACRAAPPPTLRGAAETGTAGLRGPRRFPRCPHGMASPPTWGPRTPGFGPAPPGLCCPMTEVGSPLSPPRWAAEIRGAAWAGSLPVPGCHTARGRE